MNEYVYVNEFTPDCETNIRETGNTEEVVAIDRTDEISTSRVVSPAHFEADVVVNNLGICSNAVREGSLSVKANVRCVHHCNIEITSKTT